MQKIKFTVQTHMGSVFLQKPVAEGVDRTYIQMGLVLRRNGLVFEDALAHFTRCFFSKGECQNFMRRNARIDDEMFEVFSQNTCFPGASAGDNGYRSFDCEDSFLLGLG